MSYDIKYRQRAMRYLNEGHSYRGTAATFKASPFTLQQWKNQLNVTGTLSPKKRKETWRKIDPAKLREFVGEHPDAYQYEIAAAFGVRLYGIQKALKRLKITRKKSHSFQGD